MHTRKDFLAVASLAALAPQIAVASPPRNSAGEEAEALPKLAFSVTAFEATLSKTAPHRHLFSAVPLDNGTVFVAIRNTVEAYRDALNIGYEQVFPVAVLYHGVSIALGFNDMAWNELFIPAVASGPAAVRAEFSAARKGDGNPYLHARRGHDSSLESLVADCGLRTYICNNAMRSFAISAATTLRMKPQAIYAHLTANLAPNAMVVPAGVWAIHALQERKFTVLETSV
ncbi:MAG: hypothetical protein ACYDGM_07430 [Vulcanimicrobiaceae bacterium]